MSAPLRRNGKLVKHIDSGCSSKRRYSDEYSARAMGQTMEELHKMKLFLYRCDVCRGWHLTKSDRQKKTFQEVSYMFDRSIQHRKIKSEL